MMWHRWWCNGGLRILAFFAARASLASAAVNGTRSTIEVGLVSTVTVTGSWYDPDFSVDNGCGTTGCTPELTRDGLDNSFFESRWSCNEQEASTAACYLIYEFGEAFVVDHLIMYFRESNETTRDFNKFNISTKVAAEDEFTHQLDDMNIPGTEIGTGEVFTLLPPVSAQFVRIDAVLDEGQWISINEVEIYVQNPDGSFISTTPGPTPAVVIATPAPTTPATTFASSAATTAPRGSGQTEAPLGAGDGNGTQVSTPVPSAGGSLNASTDGNTPAPSGLGGNVDTEDTSGAYGLSPPTVKVGRAASAIIAVLITAAAAGSFSLF